MSPPTAPNGRFLYVANRASNDIPAFAIDPASGALGAAGAPVPTGLDPRAIAIAW
ncbi:MAG TPA: beta-propeller fold lactonase family protein [Thermodesulfobacteriota bacterium]